MDLVAEDLNTLGWTLLSYAVEGGGDEVVKLLLEKDVDVDSKDRHGRTPLSHAAASGRQDVVKQLFEKGVDVDSKDADGRTPLSHAARFGGEEVVKLLLEKGVDVMLVGGIERRYRIVRTRGSWWGWSRCSTRERST